MTHDQTTPAPVDVTRADREAAEAFWNAYCGGNDLAWHSLSAQSQRETMRAFARHRIAHSAPAGEVVTQWRRIGSGPWWDGLPDHEDRSGPYETRTLYTHPAPPAELVEAVKHAIFVFDTYAENHAAKGTAEGQLKAKLNRHEANRLHAALAKHGGA